MKALTSWHLQISGYVYVLLCLIVALMTRTVVSALRGTPRFHDERERHKKKEEEREEYREFWPSFKHEFGSNNDLYLPLVFGFLELLIYPGLMATNQFSVIGFWIGLKTVGGWQGWKDSRLLFNVFLIGNVLVLLFSFLFSQYFVRVV